MCAPVARGDPPAADGTALDDGIKDLNEVAGMTPQIAKWLTVRDTKFLRVVSIGEVDGVRSGIWCILQAEGGTVLPVYWREESVE